MNISPVNPNPVQVGGEGPGQNASAQRMQADAEQESGRRPSSNAVGASQRVTPNQASADVGRPENQVNGRLDFYI